MLIKNIDVEGGLVNGSRGVVVELPDDKDYVIVKFMNDIEIPLPYHQWDWEDDKIIAIKKQIPLIIAYSMTIHKTQSQTLDCVKVDLGDTIFENGQAYTALSRVRSLDGLEITQLSPTRITCHKKVIQFYEELLRSQ